MINDIFVINVWFKEFKHFQVFKDFYDRSALYFNFWNQASQRKVAEWNSNWFICPSCFQKIEFEIATWLASVFFIPVYRSIWTCFRIWIFWKIDSMKIDWKRKRFGMLILNNFKNILWNLGRFLEILKKSKKKKKTFVFQKKKRKE